MKNIVTLVFLCLTAIGRAQNNTNCASMNPICTNVGVSFTANSNAGNAEPGNNYGCLSTAPNPSWYYFEVATNGNIDMSLTAPSDIDFIIYGPFNNLADAISNCGSLGNATTSPIVDCSYSGTNMETPSIPNAVVGEVYIMLITNYASIVQDISLTQTGGTGSTNCGIVPPCNTTTGTFTVYKNNQLVAGPLALCEGDSFEIRSNNDYILPADTISVPNGDGFYTAQLLFLVYDAIPTAQNPANDLGFTQLVIPNDSLFDIHDAQSNVINTLGCGTYYFVPVTADDGIGGNGNVAGNNDNGTVNWDTDGNGCYELGTPIEVKYTCPIDPTPIITCNSFHNGVNFAFPENGTYTVINNGAGSLVSPTVASPDSARVQNLAQLENYSITVTNQDGCIGQASGVFLTPQFTNITLVPGTDCPGTGLGSVYVEGQLNSGNGGLAVIQMNGVLETNTIPFDSINAAVGSSVQIRLIDQLGCFTDSSVTVNSVGHNVVINVTDLSEVSCFGDSDGSATISTFTVDGNGVPDNVPILDIDWTFVPTGFTTFGGAMDTTNFNMQAGAWVVTVTDAIGCSSAQAFNLDSPDSLILFVEASSDPQCNDLANGSIFVNHTGGTVSENSTYDWTGPGTTSTTTQIANLLPAGSFFVTLTDDNGCQASTSKVLNNPPEITASFIVKDVLCYGESTASILAANVLNGTAPYFYIWTTPNVVPPADTINKAANLPAGNYNLTIIDVVGCQSDWDFTINQNDSIYWGDLSAFKSICRTNSFQNGNGVLTVTASGGGENFGFEWTELSSGVTSNTTTWAGRNPGMYAIKATDNFGCIKTDTILLDSINPEAIFTVESAQFEGPGLYEGTEPLSIVLTNQSINLTDTLDLISTTLFEWNLDRTDENANLNWFSTTDIDQKVDTTYNGEEIYEVCLVATNANGCKDTSCVDIIVRAFPELRVPNVFTPGKSPNATFFFPQVGIAEFKAVFYNRYGIKVYEFDSPDDEWDGTNIKNGADCVDGVYFYTYEATATNGTDFKGEGNVTLIRSKN